MLCVEMINSKNLYRIISSINFTWMVLNVADFTLNNII